MNSLFSQVDTREAFIDYLSTKKEHVTQVEQILILHFDYCSSNSYCKDTAKIERFISKLSNKDLLIIDTLYDSTLPEYVLSFPNIMFISRIDLQRKGLFHDKPILIRRKKSKVRYL